MWSWQPTSRVAGLADPPTLSPRPDLLALVDDLGFFMCAYM